MLNKYNLCRSDVFCNLRYWREKEHYTQAQIAKMVGVSRYTICRIELGRYLPGILLARRLAFVLNVPIARLFPFKDIDLMNQDFKNDEIRQTNILPTHFE